MSNAYWIKANDIPAKSTEYRFFFRFQAQNGASLRAKLSADARYRLFCNSHPVCDGPCVSSSYVRHYEEADLTPYLREGENELVFRVLCIPYYEETFTTVPRRGIPCLWFDGLLTEGVKQTPLLSDEGFSCFRVDSIAYRAPSGTGLHPSLYPFEDHAAKKTLTPVPVIQLYQPEEKRYNLYGLSEAFPLTPRPIPLLSPGAPRSFAVVRREKHLLDLDAGRYTTAFPTLTFKGKPGERIRICYAECYQNEDGTKGRRDNTEGLLRGPYDTVVLSGEKQVLSPLFFRAFRYIRIEGNIESLVFFPKESSYSEYFYPFSEEGAFTCSDPIFSQMWEISRRTILCCTHETFVDTPHYELRQYDLDSALEMLYAFRLSSDPRIGAKALTDLAHSQLPDGMLQGNYPSQTCQGISCFPLYWVMMLRDYYRYTADLDTVRSLYGTLLKVMNSYENRLNADGLAAPHDSWQYVDGIPEWYVGAPNDNREKPITYDSLLYAFACQAASEVSCALGKTAFAAEYRRRKEALLCAVNTHCYDTDARLYRDTPVMSRFSQHTAMMAVLAEAVTGKEAAALLDRAMKTAPIRCGFSLGWFLLRALEKTGLYTKYADTVLDGWRTMIGNHSTTWCENPGFCRSECHGWSSAPLYEFSAVILGVTPEAPGFASVRIQPNFEIGSLTFAEGTVPTPHGAVFLRWERKKGEIVLTVRSPVNHPLPLTLYLPNQKPIFAIGEITLSFRDPATLL